MVEESGSMEAGLRANDLTRRAEEEEDECLVSMVEVGRNCASSVSNRRAEILAGVVAVVVAVVVVAVVGGVVGIAVASSAC